ncbi:RTA1-domain-containing protein [Neurospora crassa]|uniref:RTA1 domain-containing protein n=1 Tax=Neurospora crassa (strain ATCC 24698 / 74-OR23-1A / CBS 708.71 / DSM 1257 / FGSC 987) TaxID=367110 RepID=Q7S9C4_NEUCR|nr:hypothetical protein NCU05209 [Neurospora crassa OR74A]EAA32972.1 hypothetical protein NCU05209 [Neurospora crassa OR74A]KHE85407.1 RTA1-domain-containing protein [Neurospora crassa]|eukprot:XP_962208.1 hypothetical protein NCU05209 [Neurospora crassa OR74A]
MTLNDGPPFGPVVNGTMVVVFWEYRPSNVAAHLFLALFALATLAHLVYFVWLRAWGCIPLILGGICLVFGYLERSYAHSDPTKLDPWLLQNMLLLVAPPLLAASLYMSYGRISTALLEGTSKPNHGRRNNRGCCARCCYSWYRPIIIYFPDPPSLTAHCQPTNSFCTCSPTRLYVLADVAAIFTQLIGTVLPASGTESAQRLSKIIVLIGLCVQLLALGIFLFTCGRLHVRLHRNPTRSRAMLMDPGVRWLWYFGVMEVAGAMLVVRSVVRGAEYLGGTDGVVASHEWFVYVFDGVPMGVVMAGFLVLYPERVVREVKRQEGILKGAGMGEELRGGVKGESYPGGDVYVGGRCH